MTDAWTRLESVVQMTPYYSERELRELGLRSFGRDVRIDRSVRLFSPEYIDVGDRVRIDCFCLLSASTGGISIGCNVHIAAGAFIFGSGGAVVLEDFTCLSSRVSLYTSNDDYTSGGLTNPTVTREFRNVAEGDVVLRRHALLGSGSVVLPGVTIGIGASVGALTLVRKSVAPGQIVYGNPMQTLAKQRPLDVLREKELRYLDSIAQSEVGDGNK